MKGYKRICIMRCGYAVVPADTNEEAVEAAKMLSESDFDWEPVNEDLLEMAEVIEDCGPNGEFVEPKEC